jgi:hypothetical protein
MIYTYKNYNFRYILWDNYISISNGKITDTFHIINGKLDLTTSKSFPKNVLNYVAKFHKLKTFT